MSRQPSWYRRLPDYLRPDEDKIGKLEDYRKKFSLPEGVMYLTIATTRWGVVRTQEATLESLRESLPAAKERDLWKGVIVTRLQVKLDAPTPFDPQPGEIMQMIHNMDDIVTTFNSFDEVVEYILEMEEDNLVDPSGISGDVDAILSGTW